MRPVHSTSTIFKTLTSPGMRTEIRTPFNGFFNPEPSAFRYIVRTSQHVIDSSVTIAISGAASANSRWDTTWTDAVTAACQAVGATYEPSSAAIPTNPSPSAAYTGIIHFPASYTGEPIVIVRNLIANHKNDGPGGQPGTTQQDVYLSGNTAGAIATPVGSNSFFDQSLTPVGAPTFRFTFSPTGAFFPEGTAFDFGVYTENFDKVVGLTRQLQLGNVANNSSRWDTPIMATIKAAIEATPGMSWSNTTPTNASRINVTWGVGYSDATPLVWTLQSKLDQTTNTDRQSQLDLIWSDVYIPPSTPALIDYATVASLWLTDTSQTPTSPIFQIKISPVSPAPGSTITYTLSSETGVTGGGSCIISQGGTATDADFGQTFDDTMTALAAASSGQMTYDTGTKRLTVTASWSGSTSATRTLNSGTAGKKHTVQLSSPMGGAYLGIPDDVAFVGGSGATRPVSYFAGINLSGAEFSGGSPLLNGNNSIDYYDSKGFGNARFPIRWEYIQTSLMGSLNANATNIVTMVKRWTNTRGKFAMLDLHNYGKYGGVELGFGDGKPQHEAVIDLWVKLIAVCQAQSLDMSKIMIDIMNEPGMTPPSWRRAAQAIVNGIRARTDFTGMIFVEASGSSGASTWVSDGNAAEMIKIYDPAANYAFSAHQYLDRDGSGTSATCSFNAYSRLQPFIDWCSANGRLGHIGEFGWGDGTDGTTQCKTEFPQYMQLLYSNRIAAGGPIIGWNHWGDGQFWNASYIFRTFPTSLAPLVEKQLMLDFTQGKYSDNTPYIQNS